MRFAKQMKIHRSEQKNSVVSTIVLLLDRIVVRTRLRRKQEVSVSGLLDRVTKFFETNCLLSNIYILS